MIAYSTEEGVVRLTQSVEGTYFVTAQGKAFEAVGGPEPVPCAFDKEADAYDEFVWCRDRLFWRKLGVKR